MPPPTPSQLLPSEARVFVFPSGQEQFSPAVGQRVYVCLRSHKNTGNAVVKQLQDPGAEPLRYKVQYDADGTHHWARLERLQPIYDAACTLLVCRTTTDYRRLARSQVVATDHVAEVGASYGMCTHVLSQHCASVVGIDNSPMLVTEARRRYPNLRFEHVDALLDKDRLLELLRPCNKVWLDIGGNRQLESLLELIPVITHGVRPQLLVVKSEQLFDQAHQHLAAKCPTPPSCSGSGCGGVNASATTSPSPHAPASTSQHLTSGSDPSIQSASTSDPAASATAGSSRHLATMTKGSGTHCSASQPSAAATSQSPCAAPKSPPPSAASTSATTMPSTHASTMQPSSSSTELPNTSTAPSAPDPWPRLQQHHCTSLLQAGQRLCASSTSAASHSGHALLPASPEVAAHDVPQHSKHGLPSPMPEAAHDAPRRPASPRQAASSSTGDLRQPPQPCRRTDSQAMCNARAQPHLPGQLPGQLPDPTAWWHAMLQAHAPAQGSSGWHTSEGQGPLPEPWFLAARQRGFRKSCMKYPQKHSPVGVRICRPHNYDTCYKAEACPFDHTHCHHCLRIGHLGRECPVGLGEPE